jgi:hypothetical protein
LIWNVRHVAVQPKPAGGYLVWCDADNGASQAVFDSATGSFTWQEFSFTPGSVLSLPGKDSVDEAGNLWATRFAGFAGSTATYRLEYRQPNGNWVSPGQPVFASTTPSVSAFKAFGSGQALLVDEAGRLQRFAGQSWTNLGTWGGGFASSVDVDAAGNAWVAGSGGAAKRLASTGQWLRYRVTNTAQYDSFNNDLAIDPSSGQVALCANAGPGFGGLVTFDGQRWTGFNNANYGLGKPWPFPTDNADAVAYRPSLGTLAANPMFGGIHQWNGSQWSNLLGPTESSGLLEDSQGRLWSLGDYFSLRYLSQGTWTEVGLVASGRRLRLDPERPGTIWATSSHEIKRTDGNYSFSRGVDDFPFMSSQSDTFSGLAADKGGVAWVGATVQFGLGGGGGALIRIDADTGQYQTWLYDQGWPFPGQFVTPLAVTPDGRLWMQYDSDFLTAQRGLCWFDGQNVGVYPAPPFGEPQFGGLPHAQIAALEVKPISGGYELWMSCKSRGIAVLKVEQPASVATIGCGLNPVNSLNASAAPVLGSSLQLLLDNPLGSQASGSASLLALSLTAYLSPCGLPIPGWNMDPNAPNGELLAAEPYLLLLAGSPWTTPGSPSQFSFSVPNNPALLGQRVFAQGALLDVGGTGPLVGLSSGLALRFGL